MTTIKKLYGTYMAVVFLLVISLYGCEKQDDELDFFEARVENQYYEDIFFSIGDKNKVLLKEGDISDEFTIERGKYEIEITTFSGLKITNQVHFSGDRKKCIVTLSKKGIISIR